MKDQRLQAELWEIQVLLYWILAFMLLNFSEDRFLHVLGWVCVSWSIVTFAATMKKIVASTK